MGSGDHKRNQPTREAIAEREAHLARIADRKRQFNNDLSKLASMPEFRRVMGDYLGRSGIYRVTHTGNAQGAFLEGRRSLGLEILATLTDVIGDEALNIVKLDFGESNG